MTTRQDLPRLFSHHPPKGPEQAEVYEILRGAGRAFAEQVLALVPKGVEREEAIRNIRAAVMWANSGIACAPEPGEQHPVPLVEVLAKEARGVDVIDDGQFPVPGCPGCHFLVSKDWSKAGIVTFAMEAQSHLFGAHGWTGAGDWAKHGVDAWAEEHCL